MMKARTKFTGMTPGLPVEVYGHYATPRIKWSCGGCKKRNDQPVKLPVAEHETLWCSFCHRPSGFVTTQPETAAPVA